MKAHKGARECDSDREKKQQQKKQREQIKKKNNHKLKSECMIRLQA